jgi:predicted N-acetyltransferase YhbS
MITIRKEELNDAVAREALLDEAYGADRFTKASQRLREGRLPAPGLSLVSVQYGRIIGTVRFWPVTAGPGRNALLLGPLAVHPQYRNHGIGATLTRRAIARACLAGHQAILLVGDAAYYGRFGFTTALTGELWMPGRFQRERLLALELRAGALVGASGLIAAAGPLEAKPNLIRLSSGINRGPQRTPAQLPDIPFDQSCGAATMKSSPLLAAKWLEQHSLC